MSEFCINCERMGRRVAELEAELEAEFARSKDDREELEETVREFRGYIEAVCEENARYREELEGMAELVLASRGTSVLVDVEHVSRVVAAHVAKVLGAEAKDEPRCVVGLVGGDRPVCAYLRDGTKVHIARDGGAAWLEVVEQLTVSAVTAQDEPGVPICPNPGCGKDGCDHCKATRPKQGER